MAALLSSIKSPKGTFRGSDLDKIRFLSNKRKKCLTLTIEAKEADYDEQGQLTHPEEEFGDDEDDDPFEHHFNQDLAYNGNYEGSEEEAKKEDDSDSMGEESLKKYIMEHGGFANFQMVQDYEAHRNRYKNMRESEIKREFGKHMNIDFGSDAGPASVI